MQIDDAKQLRSEFKGACNHPWIEPEYDMGASTGDYRCSTCGKCFGSEEEWRQLRSTKPDQLKLHEAMREILLYQPERTATLQTLYDENVRRDLYHQDDGNGSHPPPEQFKLRTLHYREFEFIPPDRVRYIGPGD